jgi:hypothetical protein
MDNKSRERLITLMLYREIGGSGYGPAIEKLARENQELYSVLLSQINGIKEDLGA